MDTTQKVILVLFALGVLLLFVTLIAVATSEKRRAERQREKAWRERLAGPTEELEDLLLHCDLFSMELPNGPLAEDPQMARFLACVRQHDYLGAWQLCGFESFEGFVHHACYRMGDRGRPIVMDYGYLSEVFGELVRRARAANGAPYR
jgi:hypothetical protein